MWKFDLSISANQSLHVMTPNQDFLFFNSCHDFIANIHRLGNFNQCTNSLSNVAPPTEARDTKRFMTTILGLAPVGKLKSFGKMRQPRRTALWSREEENWQGIERLPDLSTAEDGKAMSFLSPSCSPSRFWVYNQE